MLFKKMRSRLCVLGLIALAVTATPAVAQPWPTRPITLVVVFSPGGPVDVVARIVAKGLSDELGQQVVVDSRPGAGGTLGAGTVARAEPDGYTLLLLNSGHTSSETLYKNRKYDLMKDFAPVSLIGTSPNWLLVNAKKSPFASMKDLVAYAKANPGKLTFASGGAGGLTHLSSELMKESAHIDMVHVPYKGNAPAFTDLIAGRVDMIFDQPIGSEAFVKSGQLKPLAVTSRTRLLAWPQVPTMIEVGFPDYDVVAWYAVAAPSATPAPVVTRLNAALTKVLNSPDTHARLVAAGVTPSPSTPQELGARMSADVAKWRGVINHAGISLD